ncbi:hypothetical protein [Trueperella sp. LYQ141]|uniref:hypothetical protein n=1 Tax=Trueperella sp. LYQ141 TaxID=3391058 RepID=UPI00398374F4
MYQPENNEQPMPQGGQQPTAQPGAYQQPYPPQPGYGYPQQQPAAPSAFGALFSVDFKRTFTPVLAKLVQIVAIIVGIGFCVTSVWGFIVLASGTEYSSPSAMVIIGSLFDTVVKISMGLLIMGASRVMLEYFVGQSQKEDK